MFIFLYNFYIILFIKKYKKNYLKINLINKIMNRQIKLKPHTWYPTLLQTSNLINSNSWFDIKKYQKSDANINKPIVNINTTYLKTYKYKLYPNPEQKNKLDKWFKISDEVYNLTNTYIKTILNDIDISNNSIKNLHKIIEFTQIRSELTHLIKEIVLDNKVNRHCMDLSIKHCVTMYKSALSNFKEGHIKKFELKDLEDNRRRKYLGVEKALFSKKKNGFCITEFGEMKSSKLFKDVVNHDSVIQYDSIKKEYYLISPKNKQCNFQLAREKLCGIDIGVRTFLTTWSDEASFEIGTNLIPKIDKYLKRLDKITSDLGNNILTKIKYNKLITKINDNIKNKIDDLHKKTASFLLKKYDIINIGKVSIKSIISNLDSNLKEITKRRLCVLSHYKFRMILKSMSIRFNSKVNEINEYMTSKTCSNCNNINYDLGSSKVYNCNSCKIIIDRDINAARNIYTL